MSEMDDGSHSAVGEPDEGQRELDMVGLMPAGRQVIDSNMLKAINMNPIHVVQKLNLFNSNHSGGAKSPEDAIEHSQLSSIDSDENALDDAEDTAGKLLHYVESSLRGVGNILEFPQIIKRVFGIFLRERPPKDGEARDEAILISGMIMNTFKVDIDLLDSIDTECISIYNPIMRERIRKNNQDLSLVLKKFVYEERDIQELIFLMLDRKATSFDSEEYQLSYLMNLLKLVLLCFEFGFFDVDNLKKLMGKLFQNTEHMFKIEQHMMQNYDLFRDEVFDLAMDCKSLISQILLQLVTFANDSWFHQEVMKEHFLTIGKTLVYGQTSSGKRIVKALDLEKKSSSINWKQIFASSKPQKYSKYSEHLIFFEDLTAYYGTFSFIMYNYLLPQLRRGDRILSSQKHQDSMLQLILYVYEFREEAFVISLQLLKDEYLSYYLELAVDEDHVSRSDKILQTIFQLLHAFTSIEKADASLSRSGIPHESKAVTAEDLEQAVTQIFSECEMLMGLQDETYSIRLLLTEKKVPELLVEVLLLMQMNITGESGDELFLQGIKVLFQLCRGNYPGLAQITKGPGWLKFQDILQGQYSVFVVLFLKQLFEEDSDSRFLHINRPFAMDLLNIYKESVNKFVGSFSYENLSSSSKEMVTLYIFTKLISLLLKEEGIEQHLREAYDLSISSAMHKGVIEFAFPVFKLNSLKIERIYEPKLTKKNWKLEDGSFLVSLMMLMGDHIKSMVVDFAHVLIMTHNLACEKYYPGSLAEDFEEALPIHMSNYNYLHQFPDGLKFKTELLVSLTTLRVFANASKISQFYSPTELSIQGQDTNLEFLPRSHLQDLPKMIIAEINLCENFSLRADAQREEILDYIVRGLCQLAVKYIGGIMWNFNAIDTDENIKSLNRYLSELSQLFHRMKNISFELRRKPRNNGVTLSPCRFDVLLNDREELMLGTLIGSLLGNITAIIEGTKYEWLFTKYKLNKTPFQLKDLDLARDYLVNEAYFLAAFKKDMNLKSKQPTIDPLSMKSGIVSGHFVHKIVEKYKNLKKKFLKEPGENMFFRVLSSKMGNINQLNLVTYIVNWLSTLEIDISSSESIWVNKRARNMIIFLNNTMFWCPPARSKLFECLEKMPEKRQKLLAIIYKGMRDSFSMLVYSPFFNNNWQIVFSRYFIFSSFIMGLCKQNCQEFKVFLGEFVPDFGCANHRKLKSSLLLDLMNTLVKYLNYSGVSFNKSALEKPSDRLSATTVVEIHFRAVIDMLSGPCVPNQTKVYLAGNQIWANMFSRFLADLNSKYYKLMDITLDYLLSLLEGNNQAIMNHFSGNLDIPVLYNFMVSLMVNLYRMTTVNMFKKGPMKSVSGLPADLEKRKKEVAAKEQTMLTHHQTRQMNHTSSSPGLKSENMNTESKDRLDKSPTKKVLNLEAGGKNKISQDALIDMFYTEINKLGDWQQLIYMYRSGDFDRHVALEVSIKIFIFLSRVAYTSKKYQIFFDKKERDLQEQYTRAGYKEDEVRTNKAQLVGAANSTEDLIVYYFMKNITSRVEIRDNFTNSEIFIFPKPPCCFFLKEATMVNFINTCQIENTEAKLIDMFENFDQFQLEMQNYQKFKSKYRALGLLATDRWFTWFRIGCYFIAFVINGILLFTVTFPNKEYDLGSLSSEIFILEGCLIILCVGIFVLWIISNFSVAWSSVYKKFIVKYPYRNPFMPTNLFLLLLEIFLKPDVINFILHITIATLALSFSPVLHTLHMLLIINISDTTKYVLKAVTEHADQLLATVMLQVILVFVLSNLIGLNYGDQFQNQAVGNVLPCTSLKSCYLSVMLLGLTKGGGISESLNVVDINDPETNFYYLMLVQMSFFVLVNIICMNVIFGIIIDTFSELRDKQRMREWDQYNICDICGIERKIFEKKGMNFDIHKGVQHNLWDYVFYLVYLQTLDIQSLTGFEYFVFSEFKNKSTAWLPINSTLFLKESKEDEQQQIAQLEKRMGELRSDLTSLVEARFNDLHSLVWIIGKKVDRALQGFKDTKDYLNGQEKDAKDAYDDTEIGGLGTEEIKIINVD